MIAAWAFSILKPWPPVSPSLIATGEAITKFISEEFPPLSTTSLNLKDPKAFLEIPSPRYWLLYPSVLIASLPSFTNITFINTLPPLICNHSQIWAVSCRPQPPKHRLAYWFKKGELD